MLLLSRYVRYSLSRGSVLLTEYAAYQCDKAQNELYDPKDAQQDLPYTTLRHVGLTESGYEREKDDMQQASF
jgi:hypothetical protein